MEFNHQQPMISSITEASIKVLTPGVHRAARSANTSRCWEGGRAGSSACPAHTLPNASLPSGCSSVASFKNKQAIIRKALS